MSTLRLCAPLLLASFAAAQTGYLVDYNLVRLFSVDLNTGVETNIASVFNNGLTAPVDLSYRALNGQLWTIDAFGGQVGRINVTNGVFTPVYQTGMSGWQGLAWDESTQRFYLSNQNGLSYVLDPVTGATTLLGASGYSFIACLDTDSNGNLFGIDFGSGTLVQVDKTTGVASPLAVTANGFQGLGIGLNGTWYATNTVDNRLHGIDPATGANTPIGGAHGSGIMLARGFDVIDSTTGSMATKTTFGTGCYRLATESFYETFAFANLFDLSNTSLYASFTGDGYLLQPGPAAWFTPAGPTSAVPLTDDQVVSRSLGFTLPYPGGSTGSVYISSNGFVWLQPNTSSGCCAGNPIGLVSDGTPRWAALWNDLNPGVGGTVHFDTDPVNGVAYVTFDRVPRHASTQLNTFQYAFHATGQVELRYQTCQVQTGATVVGWSPGNSLDPGSMDISATSAWLTRPDMLALSMDADARPVLGTTIHLICDDIPAGAPLAGIALGLTRYDPGIDLTSIGMAGCRQYCSHDAISIGIAPGASFTVPFVVPSAPSLAGLRVRSQGMVYHPAVMPNVLGASSSNGLELLLDVN